MGKAEMVSQAGQGTEGRGVRPRRDAGPRPIAALDLGTNNCRLLVARPNGTGFEVVDAFSRAVRLGETAPGPLAAIAEHSEPKPLTVGKPGYSRSRGGVAYTKGRGY